MFNAAHWGRLAGIAAAVLLVGSAVTACTTGSSGPVTVSISEFSGSDAPDDNTDNAPTIAPTGPIQPDPIRIPTDKRTLSISMTAADWRGVDGTMDNFTSDAAENGETQNVRVGTRVRDAGWKQILVGPKDSRGYGKWPSGTTKVSVKLWRSDWSTVAAALEADYRSYTTLAVGWTPTGPLDDYAKMAKDSQRVGALVGRALARS